MSHFIRQTVAPTSTDLLDIDATKTLLDSTDTATVTELVGEISDMIASTIGRPLAFATWAELVDSCGDNVLDLGRFPVEDVSEVKYGDEGVALDADEYQLSPQVGSLRRIGATWEPTRSFETWQVTYRAGWWLPGMGTNTEDVVELPRDIRAAAKSIARSTWYHRRRAPDVLEMKKGTAMVKYSLDPASGLAVPEGLMDTLRHWRRSGF